MMSKPVSFSDLGVNELVSASRHIPNVKSALRLCGATTTSLLQSHASRTIGRVLSVAKIVHGQESLSRAAASQKILSVRSFFMAATFGQTAPT